MKVPNSPATALRTVKATGVAVLVCAVQLVPTLERLIGKDKVRLSAPITGAEDFSYFSQVVPGFYFRLGVVPEGKSSTGHHTPGFYAADESVPIAMGLPSRR